MRAGLHIGITSKLVVLVPVHIAVTHVQILQDWFIAASCVGPKHVWFDLSVMRDLWAASADDTYILSTALVKSLNWLPCNRDPLIAERRAKGKASKFDAFVGRTIDVPAPIFGVDIPDLYYRGTVLKKDNAHAGTHSFAAQSSSPCFVASQSAWCILCDSHVT